MKDFNNFIEEAATKRCGAGKYWCYTDKKCKKIPKGQHIGRRGYLEPDEDETNGTNNGNGSGNGHGGNGSNGGGNGGGGNGGGGE